MSERELPTEEQLEAEINQMLQMINHDFSKFLNNCKNSQDLLA